MRHLATIREGEAPRSLLSRVLGRFYTPEVVGRELARAVLAVKPTVPDVVSVIDPFCGDGRLIDWLIQETSGREQWLAARWRIKLWDIDHRALASAVKRVREAAERFSLRASIDASVVDSFFRPLEASHDVVITNPPWEVLKPDRRDHAELIGRNASRYADHLRAYDARLLAAYPEARPARRFSGWGTNLARVGVALSLRLVARDGVAAVVTPPSLFGDQISSALRSHMFRHFGIAKLFYYPAEARLFEGVDQAVATFVCSRQHGGPLTELRTYDRELKPNVLPVDLSQLTKRTPGWCVPLAFGTGALDVHAQFAGLPTFGSLAEGNLWAGRELDETGHTRFLADRGEYRFIKGRMVGRYEVLELPDKFVSSRGPRVPSSADHDRIAWRDVSRPSQRRRVQAALIPRKWVSGNSLSVAFFRDDDITNLKKLLGVMNSFVFEFQVRSYLSTGHVSLGTVRHVAIPPLMELDSGFVSLVDARLKGDIRVENQIEARVARAYGIAKSELSRILVCFPRLTSSEAEAILRAF